jgi:hypothetical protein
MKEVKKSETVKNIDTINIIEIDWCRKHTKVRKHTLKWDWQR